MYRNFFDLFLMANAQDTKSYFAKTDAFLNKYVMKGRVDYAAIKANPVSLTQLLSDAKGIKVSKSDKDTYQAFWINTYNLLVINGIVENYPLKSPLDVAGFFDKKKHDVGGMAITLNDIENKLLRQISPMNLASISFWYVQVLVVRQ